MGKKRKAEAAAQQPGKLARAAELDATPSTEPSTSKKFVNKEKPLVLCSRGITYRFRHLMQDFMQLMPHCKKDSKLDTKRDKGVLNEAADLRGCTSVVFFEARKKKDLYMWLAKSPDGPTAKFLVANVHTMTELKLSGNHLKGSRPVLSFHKQFDDEPHLQLLKEMFTHVFATPLKHAKSKPFFDHVISFSVADGRIWIRNYQVIVDDKAAPSQLVEAGPRCCLQPIKFFAGSFGGPTLYENPEYVTPNAVRSMMKKMESKKYAKKIGARERAKAHKAKHPMPVSDMADVFAP